MMGCRLRAIGLNLSEQVHHLRLLTVLWEAAGPGHVLLAGEDKVHLMI